MEDSNLAQGLVFGLAGGLVAGMIVAYIWYRLRGQVQKAYGSVIFLHLAGRALKKNGKQVSGREHLLKTLYHVLRAMNKIDAEFKKLFKQGLFKGDPRLIITGESERRTIELALRLDGILKEYLRNTPVGLEDCTVLSDDGPDIIRDNPAYTWVLDPIDGGRHLARSLPLFTTTVALFEGDGTDKLPILSVIYAPITKELFFAVKGCGAYLNNWKTPLRVSEASLEDALIHVEFPNVTLYSKNPSDFRIQSEFVKKIFKEAYRVRGLGVGSLGLAYVAKGAFDAYITLPSSTLLHDVAAGMLIVREAGGAVKLCRTTQLVPDGVRVVAANEELMQELDELIKFDRLCAKTLDAQDTRSKDTDSANTGSEDTDSGGAGPGVKNGGKAPEPEPPLPEKEKVELLRIVVASPIDVQTERDALERVAEELNRGIAADRGLRLEIVRWETDAYPGFHAEGLQGLIDPILCIEESDILIGIFWKRFGTPTKNAKSGTEHEFRTAYKAWRQKGRPQIMVYFNRKPYDPKSQEELDQWGLVLKFKDEFPKEGLWWDYERPEAFKDLVRKHLTEYIRHQYKLPG